MTTLAVTAAGRRRYVVEALLQAASPDDVLVVTDRNPLAPALAVPGTVPAVPGEIGARAMGTLLAAHGVDALISLHDYETVEFAREVNEFEGRGIRFIGPSYTTAVKTIDKLALAEHIAEVAPGAEVPTRPVSALTDQPQDWILKDRFGSGSSGLHVVSTKSEAEAFARQRAAVLGWHPAGEPQPIEVVAQPFLRGREFNIDLFYADDGALRGHCVKEKRAMRGGETDTARVTHDELELVPRVARAISGLSLKGNVDVDVILQPNGAISVLDVNPRFGGGYAFSVLAGYDVANSIWSMAAGTPVLGYHEPRRELWASKYIAVAEVGDAILRVDALS